MGPDQQPVVLLFQNHLHVGIELLQRTHDAGRIGSGDRVGNQHESLRRGRFDLELLEEFLDHFVLLGLGPDRQLPRLRLGKDLDPRDFRRQLRKDGLESLALRRGDGVDDELVLLVRGSAFLELLDGRLDPLVVGRGGHGHDPLVARVGRHLGIRGHFLKRGHQVRRWQLRHGIELQLRRVRPRFFRLQLVDNRLDPFLIGRRGDGHQAPRRGIDRQLRLREERLQHGKRGGRVRLGEAIDIELPDSLHGRGRPELLHQGLDRLVLRGNCPGDQLAAPRVQRQFGIGNDGIQVLHQLRAAVLVDRVGLQAGLLLRRQAGPHLLQDGLDAGLHARTAVAIDLLGPQVQCKGRRRIQCLEDFQGRLRVRSLDRVNFQYRLLRRAGLGHGRRRRLDGKRIDHHLDRLHNPRPIRDEELARTRQGNRLAVRPEKRLDFSLHRRGRSPLQGKEHADHLEFPALPQFVQRDPRDQTLGDPFRDVDNQEHLLAVDQGESLGQQNAVDQVDGLGGRELAGVGVVEGPRRRVIQHQRQTRLPGKLLQHVHPFLIAVGEPQQGLGRIIGPLGPLGVGQDGGQLPVALIGCLDAILLFRLGQGLVALGDQGRDLGALLVGQLEPLGKRGVGQDRHAHRLATAIDELHLRRLGFRGLGGRRLALSRLCFRGLWLGTLCLRWLGFRRFGFRWLGLRWFCRGGFRLRGLGLRGLRLGGLRLGGLRLGRLCLRWLGFRRFGFRWLGLRWFCRGGFCLRRFRLCGLGLWGFRFSRFWPCVGRCCLSRLRLRRFRLCRLSRRCRRAGLLEGNRPSGINGNAHDCEGGQKGLIQGRW